MSQQTNQAINTESKNSLARLMATENLQIEHAKVATASFDVKNRVLRLPLWKDMNNETYDGLIGHEVGHALYTSYEDWGSFVEDFPDLKDYANIIEDARIEKKMKIKYPGMKKTFFSMYDTLRKQDFFGTQGRDLESFGFADRLNIHFKLGVRAEVPFSDEEVLFKNRVAAAETFEDVAALAKELGEFAKKEAAETNQDDIEMIPQNIEDDDDGDYEYIEVPVSSQPSEKKDDDSEEKEEKKTGMSVKSAEPEDDDSEEDDEEDETESPNAGGEENLESFQNELTPTPETVKNFEDAMENLANPDAKEPVYLDLPKTNYKNAIVGWKENLKDLSEHWTNTEHFANYYEPEIQAREKVRNETDFRVWKKDTNQIVNYMVKEFEMKQAATAHRRTAVGRSGVLDMNKLHQYKTDEDIFKRVTSVKDGRNHALMMFVDWSGSMSGKMKATMKQTLTLVMFAKKVGIPFRVYSFSNSSQLCEKLGYKDSPFYSRNQNPTQHLAMDNLGMNEYFNEKMSAKDFNKQLQNMFFLGKSLDYNGLRVPVNHGMSSTPLNECIVASYDMISDFKKETGKEKINAIFLTDGGSDCNTTYYADQNAESSFLGHSSREYMILRDTKTKQSMNGLGTRGGLTQSLLENLRNRCKINVIGFHITDRRTINQTISWGLGYDEGAKMKTFVNKNGYAPMKQTGYNTYFLINDKALDKEAEFDSLETARDNSGNVQKGQLRTQFKKFTSARKVNKMMLNEFVALVA
tara:strand:+ start:2220 stop:4466 length:2247 start_codon:yes stop_codon:yes gene_type:complete